MNCLGSALSQEHRLDLISLLESFPPLPRFTSPQTNPSVRPTAPRAAFNLVLTTEHNVWALVGSHNVNIGAQMASGGVGVYILAVGTGTPGWREERWSGPELSFKGTDQGDDAVLPLVWQ